MPEDNWGPVVSKVQQQLQKPSIDDPKSPLNVYLACLARVDQHPGDDCWYLLFDMIPVEWALLASLDQPSNWPLLPTILFHATGSPDAVVRQVLRPGEEGPIEGAWYHLSLEEGGDPSTDLIGELYPPADEFLSGKEEDAWTPRYGYWHIAEWRLRAVPVVVGTEVVLKPLPGGPGPLSAAASAPASNKRDRAMAGLEEVDVDGDFGMPGTKKIKTEPSSPQPQPFRPAFGAIGVMDIGQGGCNLLLDRHLEPILYYDVGYPLGFFRNTVPPTMRRDQATFTGPIYQNAGGNLTILLSHWDWDHWRIGAMPAFPAQGGQTLTALNWTFPRQPMSPTALNFVNHQITGAKTQVPGGTPPQVVAGGAGGAAFTYTIYKYVPPAGAFGGMLLNNSGLALRADVDLGGQVGTVLLTGDGNFGYLLPNVVNGLAGIGAVHHGSVRHGASTNLPAIPAGAASGYVAYSYGMSRATGRHAYGFPVAQAVADYHNARWNAPTEMGTAEGANLNMVHGFPAPQGNVRMGNQGALPQLYAHTSFAAIGHALP
jgi:hypothetical protein